jgi:CubicO group peptidase (beta-lactamase class C family)
MTLLALVCLVTIAAIGAAAVQKSAPRVSAAELSLARTAPPPPHAVRLFAALLQAPTAASASAATRCPPRPSPVPVPPEHFAALGADLESFFAGVLNTSGAPGLYATLTYRDAIVWSAGVGVASREASPPAAPTLDTVFRIASVTKVFVALQVYQMVERAQVASVHDALSAYEPRFSIIDPFARDPGSSRGPTLHQLMAHASGMPRELPCGSLFCNQTLAQALETLAQFELIVPPYTRASYSNAGFALLGNILSATARAASWAQYVVTQIAQPLGMTSTGAEFTPAILARMATGYQAPNYTPLPHYDLGATTAPCGQMFSTPRDLALLAVELCGEYGSASRRLFKFADTAAQMLTPALFMTGDGARPWGTPWENSVDAGTGFTVRRKSGNLPGFTALFSLVPELRVALTLNVNYGIDELTVADQVWALILPALVRTLLPLQPPPPLLPANASAYAGVYRLAGQPAASPTIPIILDADGRHLWVQTPGFAYLTIDGPYAAFGHVRFAQSASACLAEAGSALRDEQVVYDIRDGAVVGIYVPAQLMYLVRA